MTMLSWPDDLPRPDRGGFQGEASDGRRSTPLDAGPPRVRLRFSAAATSIAMAITVTADQRARFERFWRQESRGGSRAFVMTDWRFDGHDIASSDGPALTTEAGAPLRIEARQLAMFADGRPREVPVGNGWRISFSVLWLP